MPVAVFQYISVPWPAVRRNKYCAANVALRARGLAMRVSTTHASNCPRRVRPRCGCVRVDAGERMPAVCRRWDARPYGVGTYWDELPHTQSTTGCPRAWQHRINRLFRGTSAAGAISHPASSLCRHIHINHTLPSSPLKAHAGTRACAHTQGWGSTVTHKTACTHESRPAVPTSQRYATAPDRWPCSAPAVAPVATFPLRRTPADPPGRGEWGRTCD